MIRLIAATAFTLVIVTSTHAITLAPLHQSDGMVTQVGHACGSGMHMANGRTQRPDHFQRIHPLPPQMAGIKIGGDGVGDGMAQTQQ